MAQHAEVLHDLTVRYLERRAPNQIAVAKLHAEQTHVHVHVMLSSNEFSKAARVRLSKTEFLGIQREMERYVLSHYPNLENQPVYALDRGEAGAATKGSVMIRS